MNGLQNVRIESDFVYYELKGPVDTFKYRTNGEISEFFSEDAVRGICRRGWNVTKSATVQMISRRVFKDSLQ